MGSLWVGFLVRPVCGFCCLFVLCCLGLCFGFGLIALLLFNVVRVYVGEWLLWI